MTENTNANLCDLDDLAQNPVPKTENTVTDGDSLLKNHSMLLGSKEYMEIIGTPKQRQEMFEAWAGFIGEVSNPLKTAANYNKGNYAPLNEVLDETRPLLSKYGFGPMQFPVVAGTKVSITTILFFKNGACWTFPPLTMNAAKDDPQTIIATVTYGRRAALNAILVVYGENDDDGNAASGAKQQKGKAIQKADVSELDIAKQNIIKLCSKKVKEGMDKELLYSIISENNNGSRQPHTIPNMQVANTIMEKLKAVE